MNLGIRDLYRIETRLRFHADRLRFEWPESMLSDPAVSPEMKTKARNERTAAEDFDQAGNLLVGLQGKWDRLAPEVRQGFIDVMRSFDAQKPASEPVAEDDAA